jgi:hypothetical protein
MVLSHTYWNALSSQETLESAWSNRRRTSHRFSGRCEAMTALEIREGVYIVRPLGTKVAIQAQ